MAFHVSDMNPWVEYFQFEIILLFMARAHLMAELIYLC